MLSKLWCSAARSLCQSSCQATGCSSKSRAHVCRPHCSSSPASRRCTCAKTNSGGTEAIPAPLINAVSVRGANRLLSQQKRATRSTQAGARTAVACLSEDLLGTGTSSLRRGLREAPNSNRVQITTLLRSAQHSRLRGDDCGASETSLASKRRPAQGCT